MALWQTILVGYACGWAASVAHVFSTDIHVEPVAPVTWGTYFTAMLVALSWPAVVPYHFLSAVRMIIKERR